MPVAADLLEILACPECREPVKPEPITGALAKSIVERYRDRFKDEEPIVEDGLRCPKCRRLYPIVSEIPVMLIEEAIAPDAKG
jgi:uncharacterized protein YbaR (Trm112 family)